MGGRSAEPVRFLYVFYVVTSLGTIASHVESESPAWLDPVVVTATRTERTLRTVPATVRVFDTSALQASESWTLGELLRSESGVDVQSAGLPGAAERLSLRGLTEGYRCVRVLVLMDGVRLHSPFTGNAETGLLPLDAAERVELLKGPHSALYGSAAMGGVLSVTTRRGGTTPRREIAFEGGSHGTLRWRAALGGPFPQGDYFVQGGRELTDGYRRTRDGRRCDWEAWFADLNAGWHFSPHSHLRAITGVYAGEGTDDSADRSSRRDRQVLESNWLWDPRSEARLTTRLWRLGQRDRYDWTYPGVGLYRQQAFGAEAQQSGWVGDRHRATLGLELREDEARVDDVASRLRESVTSGALYGQDEIVLAERWSVTLGVRADGDEKFGIAWSPRSGLVWQPLESMDVFLSAGRAYRAPSLSDRYVRAQYQGAWFVGNPDLRPETLWAFETGVRARGRKIGAELSAFWNELKDAFDFRLEPDGTYRNSNVTRMYTAGVEMAARWEVWEGWLLWGTYALVEGAYEEGPRPDMEGNRPAYLAPHKGSLGLTWANRRMGRHELLLRYVGSRYGDSSNTPENRMDAYARVDWRSRVPMGRHAAASLRVDNLLDEEYQEMPHRPQPGRSLFGGIELTF